MISVIIPTKNNVAILLESIHKLLPFISEEIEVIIVNDGEYFEFPKKIKFKITFLDNKNRGVSNARNYGAAMAKGNILFFIDDDMWVNFEAFNEINRLIRNNLLETNVYILNWVYPKELIKNLQKSKLGRYLIKTKYHTALGRMHITDEDEKIIQINGIGSGSMVISKNLFLEIGGYNENINFQGEDIEFSNKLKKNRVNIFFDMNVCLEHNQAHRLNIYKYLERLENGYKSEFMAIRNDLIRDNHLYQSRFKYILYIALIPFENWLLTFFKLLPNKPFFDSISFKAINLLSGLQLIKNLRHHFKILNQA